MRKSTLEDGGMGPFLNSPADDLVDKAWEARTPGQRRKLARRALKADLDCVDAYNLLALSAESRAETIALLREAVRIGERLFAPVLDDPEMAWWGFIGTRPWMRALHHLALMLEEAGDVDEAEALYRRMLELNPSDNQGVRFLLLRRLCHAGRVADCRAQLAEYPDDWSVESSMTALWADLAEGDRAAAEARVPEIREQNPHVLPLLIEVLRGKRQASDDYEFIEPGGESEADVYAANYTLQQKWLNRISITNLIRIKNTQYLYLMIEVQLERSNTSEARNRRLILIYILKDITNLSQSSVNGQQVLTI